MNARPQQSSVRFIDTLFNFVSGIGGLRDKSTHARYIVVEMDRVQLEAAFRGDWVSRKVITIPAHDATREWRAWQAEGDQIEQLEDVEKALRLRHKVKKVLWKARLYGGAALILGVDDGVSPDQPLEVERVRSGALKFVHVVAQHEVEAGPLITDLLSPWFGEPAYYKRRVRPDLVKRGAEQQTNPNLNLAEVDIHPSRVIRFLGNELPDDEQVRSEKWGDSILQSVYDAVRGAGLVTGGISALIDELKTDIIKVPGFTANASTLAGQQRLTTRFAYANEVKSSINALLLDSEEEWNRIQTNIAGMPDLMREYMVLASGAADIPVTRLLGQAPAGLNSTGESDIRNYYDAIKHQQANEIEPKLNALDEVLICSVFGKRDPEIFYNWNPLWQLSDTEKAEIAAKKSASFKIECDTGMIPDVVLGEVRVNQLIEDGVYPGLEEAMKDFDFESFLGTPEEQAEFEEKEAQLRIQPPEPRLALPAPKKKAAAKDAAERWRDMVHDATPRTLYVRRDVLNAKQIIAWAKEQGFASTLPASDLHVTVIYSKSEVDWMKIGSEYVYSPENDGELTVPPGGPRLLEEFDGGAIVLMFSNTSLQWRHEAMKREGASSSYAEYQPHVTITYTKGDVDLDEVEPYRGEIVLGPEIFEEIVEGGFDPGTTRERRLRRDAWNPRQPRDPEGSPTGGRWSGGGRARPFGSVEHYKVSMSIPGDPDQPTPVLSELYDRAKKVEPRFKKDVYDFAAMSGGQVMVTPPEFSEPGTILKSRMSAQRKVEDELGGDVAKLRDVLRATIVHDSVLDSRKAAAYFIESKGSDVLRVKDRIAEVNTGYRDILVNFRTHDGLVAEIQFNATAMIKAKLGEGHRIYEQRRAANQLHLTDSQLADLLSQEAKVYDAAYKAAGNGSWRK